MQINRDIPFSPWVLRASEVPRARVGADMLLPFTQEALIKDA